VFISWETLKVADFYYTTAGSYIETQNPSPSGSTLPGDCNIPDILNVTNWFGIKLRFPLPWVPNNWHILAMKSLTEHLWFETPHRRDYLNITGQVEQLVRQSGVQEGLCLVNAMHITASVYINDAEDGLLHDYDAWLEKLAPHEPTSQYQHNRTGEDNADAHMKRQVMGREVVVAITNGQLDLGPWEQIFYGEFDGRRRKRVLVKIIGE
jgi:secondary thiamine-phosphate synthase enzyme